MPAESPLRDRDGPGFQLIETMRWEPRIGFARLERHLARLYASAAELGFACDPERVGTVLGTVGGDAMLRVRLLLAADGTATVTSQPHEPLPAGTVWTARIAATRIDSADPLLRHKTTRRDLYQKARAECPVWQADELILLNERGEVCEATITTLFADPGDGGPLLTPPLSSGLLAGVLRAEMLATGEAREAVLAETDLWSAKAVWLGNSLRGLARVSLAAVR